MNFQNCDICGRLLDPVMLFKDEDPDDYTYGEIEVDPREWFKQTDVYKRCANNVTRLLNRKCWIL